MKGNMFAVTIETEQRLPLYVTTAGGWDNQEAMYRADGFSDYQWLQCLSGEGVLRTEGRQMTVGRGQGMLLFPDREHEYYPVGEPWEVMWVSFNGGQVESVLDSLGFTGSRTLNLSHPDALLKHMHAMFTTLRSPDPLHGFEGSALLYRLLLDLAVYGSPAETRSRRQHYEQLSPVLGYIEEAYARPVTLAEMADCLNVSPQYTCHLFQQTLGIRPFEYLTRVRLRKAKEMLLQNIDSEVREIAQQVGYEHPSYFIKLFKRQEGLTPTAYRRIHRLSPQAAGR